MEKKESMRCIILSEISHLFSLGTQSKKVDILTEWNHLCQKLLQRWNYLRELDELHQSFHFNLPSSSHATSTYHDACTHMPLRHEFLNSLRPLTMYVLQTLPSTSVSITDPELKTRLHPGPTPHLVTLKDLKYLIYELRERIPRCSEPALRECQRTFFPLLHTLTATPTGPWHLGLLSTKSLPMALYRMHVLATALEEDGLPWTFFESEWHQCLELVHHRLATFHLEGKKPTTSTSVSTSLIQPNEEKPSTIKKPSFQRKGVGPGLRSCPPSHSTDSSKMALMVDELKHVLLLRNTNVAVS
ncbi:hypothetical protein HMI54_015097 [Coelomomyces lativittatus]|nr:hypothetical protein HMI55_003093 [Coelomomyces lativittatus]KAJ1518554.1 hypothetical protein HMI54_015097 [Coelomomyces lativittatus]